MNLLGKLPWRSVAERRVRPNLVVVFPPFGGLAPSFKNSQEVMSVEQLVTNLSVQRFDLSILGRFAGIDEVQLDRSFSAPPQHGVARELRSVVKTDCLGEAAFKSEILKTANDVVASKGEPDLQSETFASEIVDDRDRPNISAFVSRSWTKSMDQRSLGRETAGTTLPRM